LEAHPVRRSALPRKRRGATIGVVPQPPIPACRIAIKVVPGAPRDEIAGELGGAIRVKLRAPPVDGRANAALVRFLAERLGLHASALRLAAGETGRRKIVAITGLDLAEARRRLSGG
jgi:hypothetical protein